ncbi:MAG: helix-turn-helix domain-containing protein [Caldilineales bacterium]|nr:helix-turn-helix domain-containing protein [Caldilineales bacterium]
MDEERRWLTLSAASKLLGVHPATLRQWADAGQVPSYRTPGGHRRFAAEDLRAFLVKASVLPHHTEPLSIEAALVEAALSQTRDELSNLPANESGWFEAFDAAGRERQRQLGRQLFEHAVRFVAHPEERRLLLVEAQVLGAAYAENALRYDITLLETVRAFQYFRRSLLQALTDSEAGKHIVTASDLTLRQATDTFLNEVLYGLIDAYEGALLGAEQPQEAA